MKYLSRFLLIALTLAVASAQPSGPEALGETNPFAALTGNRFDGTWTGMSLGPTPQVLSIERSGTFILQTAFQAGGYSVMGNSFTAIQGSWRRSGSRSMEMLGIRFIFGPNKKLFSAERVVVNLAFGEDFDTLQGEATLEEVLCEDVAAPPPFTVLPSCPEIATAPADIVRGPLAVSLTRLKFGVGH